MNRERWRWVTDFSAWFYGYVAEVRYDPSERRKKSDRYHAAAMRIKAGTAPEDVGLPGVETRPFASQSQR